MTDTIVFDIETKNFFTDPEVGWNNFDALEISAVGIYSYERDIYHCFEESEIEAAASFFRNAGRIVGFSINRYDVPVLNRYFQSLQNPDKVNLWEKERVDLLEDIERATGQRIGLSKLARINLGVGKDSNGAEAIAFYKNGEIEKLKAYCLGDVRLTKELYDLYCRDGSLILPNRENGEPVKVNLLQREGKLIHRNT